MKLLTFIASCFTGLMIFMFGSNTNIINLLWILIFFMVTDMITGMLNAINHKDFKWNIIRKGLFKKISTLFLVSIAYQIDKTGFLHEAMLLQNITLAVFIGYEAISILNNIEIQGIKIPTLLKKAIGTLVKKGDDNG